MMAIVVQNNYMVYSSFLEMTQNTSYVAGITGLACRKGPLPDLPYENATCARRVSKRLTKLSTSLQTQPAEEF